MSFPSLQLLPAVASALRDSGYGVVVTGAGGWLGQAALMMLDAALGEQGQERLVAFSAAPRPVNLRSGRTVHSHALATMATELAARPARPWLFFHFAFLTRDKVSVQPLEDYVRRNRAITETLVAAMRDVKVAGIFTPSSGAVYRKDRTLETDLASNPYGLLKLEDETIFARLAETAGCAAVIPRVFNLSGPYINKLEHYALASLILAVRRGGPVTIRAAHRVVRSYVQVGDVINLATALLLAPGARSVEIFDTAGERSVELSELATCIMSVLGTAVTIERPPLADPPQSTDGADIYVGDGTRLRTLASEHALALRPLPQQVADTAEFLALTDPAS